MKKPHRTQISITIKNDLVEWLDTEILLESWRSRGEIIEKALLEYKKAKKKNDGI